MVWPLATGVDKCFRFFTASLQRATSGHLLFRSNTLMFWGCRTRAFYIHSVVDFNRGLGFQAIFLLQCPVMCTQMPGLRVPPTRGVTVSMSAFLACHQCYCTGSSLTHLGLESSGCSMWHFLKLVARGFLRVLRFPPLLHRFNDSANKIKLK